MSVIIVGGGQAGLSISRELTLRSIDHLVLEKGSPGEAWRNDRWNSLRLLTPNWANRLPGELATDQDPDGFSSAREFSDRLVTYSKAIAAPLMADTTVTSASATDTGFLVETDQGPYCSRALVIASGATTKASVPPLASEVPGNVSQLSAYDYKSPAQLPEGGTMVIGASASGAQLAREIRSSGRSVLLCVGAHTRLPRSYLGRDIEHWLDATGALDETIDDVDDIHRARHTPSPQLTGSPYAVDLNALQAFGVEIAGRLMAIHDRKAMFSGGLSHVCASADIKMNRFLDRVDELVGDELISRRSRLCERPEPTRVPRVPKLEFGLQNGRVASIVWATGYLPDFSWVHLPVFDRRMRLLHNGGVAAYPGLYAMGLTFMRRRRSHQISGVGRDARDIAEHLAAFLDRQVKAHRACYAGVSSI